MSQAEINRRLRARVAERDALLVPGATNALGARIIADLGFEAVYVSGGGITNTQMALPDLSFISLPDLVQHVAAFRDAAGLPIIVDADTGFGNPLNARHTVRQLERAGASAVQLEDQVMPKRCGHFTGKEVVPAGDMVAKLKAACDARDDAAFMIIARTDARAPEGFDAAVERSLRYLEAGADAIFLEAPESVDEIRRIPGLIPAPHMINMVVGGRTPILERAELKALGYAMVLYANAALQGAIYGMQQALGRLKITGRLDEDGPVAGLAERQRLLGKPGFDALAAKYAAG